jgi:hypothetical protein
MSDLYEHMVRDIGVAESKSLSELRYLLSLNVCVWWVIGSDACGMGQFCACATGFSGKVVFVLGAVHPLSVREAGRSLSGAWTSGTHFPWWTVRVPGPMHNDQQGRRTLKMGMGVVTRTIRVTKWRRTRMQYQTGTTPQSLSCSRTAVFCAAFAFCQRESHSFVECGLPDNLARV